MVEKLKYAPYPTVDLEERDRVYEANKVKIAAGEEVWQDRDFDCKDERIADGYFMRRHVGYVIMQIAPPYECNAFLITAENEAQRIDFEGYLSFPRACRLIMKEVTR